MAAWLTLCLAWCASAWAARVNVSPTTPVDTEVKPGAVVAVGYRMATDEPIHVVEDILVPDGWVKLFNPQPHLLDPNSPTVRLVGLRVPDDVAAGSYDIVIRARAGGLTTEQHFALQVHRSDTLLVDTIGGSESITEDGTFQARARVTNRAAGMETISLTAAGDAGYRVTVEPPLLQLRPGASADVMVHGAPSKAGADGGNVRLALAASSKSGATDTAEWLFARQIVGPKRAPRRYANFELGAAGSIQKGIFNPTLRLAGTSGYGRNRQNRSSANVQYLPGVMGSASGLTANATLNHHGWGTLAVGYFPLALGVGGGGAGWGVQGGLTFSRLSVLTGVTIAPGSESGLSFMTQSQYSITDKNSVQALIFGSTRNNELRSLSVSGGATLSPANGHSIRAIFATTAVSEGVTNGVVGSLAANGAMGRFNYSTQWSSNAQTRGEQLLKSDALNLGTQVRLSDVVSLNVRGVGSGANWDRVPQLGAAPRNIGVSAGMGLRAVRTAASVNLGGAYSRSIDLLDGLASEREALGLVSIGLPVGGWSSSLSGQVGYRLAYDADPELLTSVQANISGRVNGLIVGGIGSWATQTSMSMFFNPQSFLGLTASGPVAPRTSVAGSLFMTPGSKAPSGFVSGSWSSRSGVALSAQGRFNARKEFFDGGQVMVNVPFLVPIGLDPYVGSIRGRVVDSASVEAQGVAGVCVTAGGISALTDENGGFLIAGLIPGPVALTLSIPPVRARELMWDKQAIDLKVTGGKVLEVEIPLVTRARIHGRVFRQSLGAVTDILGDGELVGTTGVQGAKLLLQGPGVRTVVLSDEQGNFAFESLLPGKYQLTASQGNMRSSFDIASPSHSLDITPGEDETVNLLVRQRARQIRMMESADLGTSSASDVGRTLSEAASGDAQLLIEPDSGFVLGSGRKQKVKVWAARPDGRRRDVSSAVQLVSSDPSVVQVKGNEITALKSGNATVYAEVGTARSAGMTVEVLESGIEGVVVDWTDIAMPAATAVPMRVGVLFEDGSVRSAQQRVTWRSSNPEIATVENGVLLAHKQGSTLLFANWGQERTLPVRVVVEAPKIQRVVVPNGPPSGVVELTVGAGLRLQAMDGNFDRSSLVVWRADSGSVRVEPDGTVFAVRPGVAMISASTVNSDFTPIVVRILPAPPAPTPEAPPGGGTP